MGLSMKPPAGSVNTITNVLAVLLNVKEGFPRFRIILIDIVRLDNDYYYYLRDWSLSYATRLFTILSYNYPRNRLNLMP